jgi:hypothetical protein
MIGMEEDGGTRTASERSAHCGYVEQIYHAERVGRKACTGRRIGQATGPRRAARQVRSHANTGAVQVSSMTTRVT